MYMYELCSLFWGHEERVLGPASYLPCYFRWQMATKRLQTGKHGLMSRWQRAKANTHDWNKRLSPRGSIVYVNIGQAK
jgi:hypothetical protein